MTLHLIMSVGLGTITLIGLVSIGVGRAEGTIAPQLVNV